LFCVATKSRARTEREHALNLLHKLGRKEKNWNSCVATLVARAILGTENKYSLERNAKDVPEDCRVQVANVVLDPREQKIVVAYRRMTTTGSAEKELQSTNMPWQPPADWDFDFVYISSKSLSCFGYVGVHLDVPAPLDW
jgi:hypothetical protein